MKNTHTTLAPRMQSISHMSRMTRVYRTVVRYGMGLFSLALLACEEHNIIAVIDDPPPAPQGVTTVRGDNRVTVEWIPVEAYDFNHYRVYRGFDSTDGSIFTFVGPSTDEQFVDGNVTNGDRYYYAVTAVDDAGNESNQSIEDAGATPRYDGFNVTLAVQDLNAGRSGFDLSAGEIVSAGSIRADLWIDRDIDGILYINADTIPSIGDIQDMGWTSSLDDIGYAPFDGWSALGYNEVVPAHTYVFWTGNDHYAKVRVTAVTATTVTFDYAYQSGDSQDGTGGEAQLKIIPGVTGSKVDRESGAHRTNLTVRPKNGRM